MTGASVVMGESMRENVGEAARWWNTERPLTHSLDITEEGIAVKATRTCTVAGCPAPHSGLGLCKAHYRRLRRYGSPLAYRPTTVGRFWAKVALPDENGCMLWLGARTEGYGSFKAGGGQGYAHRFSLLLSVGEPPEGKTDAAHSCRKRHCVAPAHLRWASRQENVDDMVRDGTKPEGDRNGQRKLTIELASEIRRRYANGGITQRRLGDEYGVTQSTIRMIVIGRTWRCSEESEDAAS